MAESFPCIFFLGLWKQLNLFVLQGNWHIIIQKELFSFFLQHFQFFLQLSPLFYLFIDHKLSMEWCSPLESTYFILLLHSSFHFSSNNLILHFSRLMTPLTVHSKVLFMSWMIQTWRWMLRSQLQAKVMFTFDTASGLFDLIVTLPTCCFQCLVRFD